MKLSHTLDNQFPQTHLTIETQLDECLRTLFPNEEYILNSMKNIRRRDKTYVSSYNMGFLPYHTADNNWLAKYLEISYNHRQSMKPLMKKIPFGYIRSYVESSHKFDALRSRYEQNLVAAYIKITQDINHDDFYAKTLVKTADYNHPDYDCLLRDRFIGAMQYLGLDKFSIESGIELNAYLWRDKARKQTFINLFSGYDMKNLIGHKGLLAKNMPDKWVHLIDLSEKLYEKWSKLADYQYYQKHGSIIDNLGLATPDMLITKEAADKLESQVDALRFTFECRLCNATQYLTQTGNKIYKGEILNK